MCERPHVFGLDPHDLGELVAQWGMPSYRADQLLHWVYEMRVVDPDEMTNLSAADRGQLANRLLFGSGRVVQQQLASDGVQKLLVEWPHHGTGSTECVMIPSGKRFTACISSQVGCPVGCRFCASGLSGLEANLDRGQMVEQVWRLGSLPGVARITHVVFMGMGEPLANFEQLVAALRLLTADWGLGIAARHITVSTVGLPAQIRRLADLHMQVTLAISLHAPEDELRRQLIPWAQFVSIDQLVESGRYYFEATGREVTLEYILLRDINDRPSHAQQLARVAQRLRSNVNLIRYNEVDGVSYGRPRDEDVRRFEVQLRAAGVNCHIRASRGRDIAAACGQLARSS